MTILTNHIPFPHSTDFHINVENGNIILHGNPDDAAGVMLRGSVILNCQETTKVKSISLKFYGQARAHWTEGTPTNQRHYKGEKDIIKHEWTFLPSNKKSYHLPEGHYKWDFELPLPGDLPESLEHEYGQVFYRLKATVERPTFLMNYHDKKSIIISRVASTPSTQSMIISNTWVDKLSYDITVPSAVASMGSLIPITFALSPIAHDLHVKSVTCVLKEYTTLTIEDHIMEEEKVVQVLKDEQFSISGPNEWNKTELLAVPDFSTNQIRTDSYSDLIKIRHKLKFTVSLTNSDGHISELRASLPIIISELSPEEEENTLPAYEDAWRTAPYSQHSDLAPSLVFSPPNSIRSRPNTLRSASESITDDEEIDPPAVPCSAHPIDFLCNPWEGIDLSRVPSYTTAVRTNRLYSLTGSSPGYDTVPGIVA